MSFMLSISGCSESKIYHGYTFSDVQNLEQKIQSFFKTKASIERVRLELGSPSFTEIVQNKNGERKYDFFYVQNIFVRKAFIGEQKSDSQVLKISFGYDGRVEKIKFYTVQGKGFIDTSTKTEVKGNELKFLDQMIKNIANDSK